jgi:serine/threonine protein phosphatase PrpC
MFKVQAYGATHVGRERKNNEDSFRIEPEAGLFLVCDGMGGHASGEVASQIAAEAMVRFVGSDRFRPDFRWPAEVTHQLTEEGRALDAAVRMANVEVYAAALGNLAHKGMGTTVVGMLAGPHRLGLVHVGDSRIYRLRGGDLEQLTDDHSLLNHYMRTRPMSSQQIRAFAGKNVIVRAVGLRDSVDPDVQTQDYRAGDVYMLCSDGLTDMVDDERILPALLAHKDDLEQACARLIDLALEGGGKDNITLVLLSVLSAGPDDRDLEDQRLTEPVRQEDTSPGFDIRSGGDHRDAETLPDIAVPQIPRAFAQTRQVPWRAQALPSQPRDTPPDARLKDTDRYRRVETDETGVPRGQPTQTPPGYTRQPHPPGVPVQELDSTEQNTAPIARDVAEAARRAHDLTSDVRQAMRETQLDKPRGPVPTPPVDARLPGDPHLPADEPTEPDPFRHLQAPAAPPATPGERDPDAT